MLVLILRLSDNTRNSGSGPCTSGPPDQCSAEISRFVSHTPTPLVWRALSISAWHELYLYFPRTSRSVISPIPGRFQLVRIRINGSLMPIRIFSLCRHLLYNPPPSSSSSSFFILPIQCVPPDSPPSTTQTLTSNPSLHSENTGNS